MYCNASALPADCKQKPKRQLTPNDNTNPNPNPADPADRKRHFTTRAQKNTPFVIGNKLSVVPVMMSLISYLSLDMVSHYVNPHISTQHRASVLLLLELLSVRADVLSCPFCRRY